MKKLVLFNFFLIFTISCVKKEIKVTEELNPDSEQAVIINFNYNLENFDSLNILEEKIESFLVEKNIGDYDGHEIATDLSDGYLYFYSTNAEILFENIKPTLSSMNFMKGAKARIRFGKPGSKEKEVIIQ